MAERFLSRKIAQTALPLVALTTLLGGAAIGLGRAFPNASVEQFLNDPNKKALVVSPDGEELAKITEITIPDEDPCLEIDLLTPNGNTQILFDTIPGGIIDNFSWLPDNQIAFEYIHQDPDDIAYGGFSKQDENIGNNEEEQVFIDMQDS